YKNCNSFFLTMNESFV
ncbi:unnamed protein product, partial [Callosobruchus maculatus]